MPTRANAMPSPAAMNDLSVEPLDSDETQLKVKITRAKYSQGPKRRAKSASVGEITTRQRPDRQPPMIEE